MPSADKYAALKDLDEQLKECKFNGNSTENGVITNGNGALPVDPFNTSTTTSSSNPFKNPFNATFGAVPAVTSGLAAANGNGNASPWTALDASGMHLNGESAMKNGNGWTIANGFATQFGATTNGGFGHTVPQTSLFDMNGFGSMTQPTTGFQTTPASTIGRGFSGTANPFAVSNH